MVKKIILTLLSKFVSSAGTLIFNFTLVLVLTQENYGNFVTFYSVLIGISVIAKFGVGTAMTKNIAIFESEKDRISTRRIIRNGYIFVVVNSAILILIALLLFDYIIDFYSLDHENKNAFRLFLFVLPIYALLFVQASIIKGFKKPFLSPLIERGMSVLGCSVIIYGLHMYSVIITLEAVVYSYVFSNVIVFLWGYSIVSMYSKNSIIKSLVIKRNWNNIIRPIPNYFLLTMTTYIFKHSAILILGYQVAASDVAIYGITNNISFLISFPLWVVASVVSPYFAVNSAKSYDKVTNKILTKSILLTVLLSTPIFVFILFYADSILLHFGENYIDGKAVLIILSAGQYINSITGPVYHLYNMIGEEKYLRNVIYTVSTITLLLLLIFTKEFGLIGASIIISTSFATQNLFLLFRYYSRQKSVNI